MYFSRLEKSLERTFRSPRNAGVLSVVAAVGTEAMGRVCKASTVLFRRQHATAYGTVLDVAPRPK
jgi:hypothetical protein